MDPSTHPPASRWWLLPSAAAGVTAATLLRPAIGVLVVAAAAVVAAALATTARRAWGPVALPRTARTWTLVVAALWAFAVAEGAGAVRRFGLDDGPELDTAALGSAAIAATLLAVALHRWVARPAAQDAGTRLDTGVLVAVVAMAAVLVVVGPVWAELDPHGSLRPVLAFHGLAHLLLLASLLRLSLSARPPTRSATLLGAGATALALAPLVLAVQLIPGSWLPPAGHLLPAVLGYTLVAAAVRDPSAPVTRIDPTSVRTPSRRARLVLLGGATALVPVVLVGWEPTAWPIALGVACVLALVVARVVFLVEELEALRHSDVAEQRERDHRRLEALVAHTADVVLVLDERGRVTYASPAARSVLGADPLGWRQSQLASAVHPDERDATVAALRERLQEAEGTPVRLTARLRDHHGREHHVEIVAVDLRDDPDIAGTVLTLHETTEQAELERRLRHLAFHDALTGLTNRPLLLDRLALAQARARRVGVQNAVLLLDLDGFKAVNDRLGHAAGDQVLCIVADRLESVTRATDTVSRLGGDEFAILCEDIGTARAAITTARRALEVLGEPIVLGDHHLDIGVSIGVVVDTGERDPEELLRDADVALYEAKAEGHQRFALHRAAMTSRAQARLQLSGDLARAIADDRIEVAFQPIVALPEGRIVGVETLARWDHETRGPISPAEFIEVAEQTGAIVRLGDLVLRRSLATLRGWLDDRPELVLRMAVNVSTRQLRDPGLVGRIAELLATYDIPPSWLVLELTESTMLDDVEGALSVMHQLRSFGVRFAIDDFGTGYSSLAYLHRLPIDIVKIDRSFVSELGQDASADQLVRAVVELGRNLGLDTLAEGVETEHQLATLEAMGCGFAQGYLVSPPVPGDRLRDRLLDRATAVTTDVRETGIRLPLPTPSDETTT